MGACNFLETTTGANAKDAFRNAVEDARHENGHDGYTGTIAEKDRFTMAGSAETVDEAVELAEERTDEMPWDDKWGPAGCIRVTKERSASGQPLFVFFGWASS